MKAQPDAHHLKCVICGRFISYDDFDRAQIITNFTPDTEFSVEETYYTHLSCWKNRKTENSTIAPPPQTHKEEKK